MAEATGNGAYPAPTWFGEFRAAYVSAQAFILHGNVQDYVAPSTRLTTFLTRKLEKSREIIAYYDRAHGVTFASAEMEEKALKILGMDGDSPSQMAGSDASLLASLGYSQDGGGGGNPLPKAPAAALPLLEKLLQADVSTAVIIEFAEHVCPFQDVATMGPDDRAAQIILRGWGTDRKIKERGNVVFLITELLTDIAPSIRSAAACWHAIDVPLPREKERERFIDSYLAAWTLDLEMTAPELARATAGLSLVHIEKIFLQANAIGQLTRSLVRLAKQSIIASEYAGLLTIMEPTYGFEAVGGMEPLKNWARGEIMAPVREGRINDVPGGVLFVGPPGTGKSHFVRALAREVGFNAVALNLENIMSKWQGQSERDMARALGVVKSLAPVLLFMDELDQSEGASRGQNSGSPSGKNIFNQLLQFLADPETRGNVIFFGASNRPDLIDPALMRFGRIDAIVPIMLPSQEEREAVARAAARSQGVSLSEKAAKAVAEGSKRYSCADVAAIVTKARKVAGQSGAMTIGEEHAQRALRTIRPATLKQAAYYESLALDACNDTELLPEEYARRLDDRPALTQAIRDAQEESGILPQRKREL